MILLVLLACLLVGCTPPTNITSSICIVIVPPGEAETTTTEATGPRKRVTVQLVGGSSCTIETSAHQKDGDAGRD